MFVYPRQHRSRVVAASVGTHEAVIVGIDVYIRNRQVASVLYHLDVLGTAVFAFGAAVTAGTRGMNYLGMLIVGVITSVGGGTLRDALLLPGAVAAQGALGCFWLRDTTYLTTALWASIAAAVSWPRITRSVSPEVASNGSVEGVLPFWAWLDHLALGTFAVVGARAGLIANTAVVGAIICGGMTACGGGVVRDVLTGRPPRVLHSNAEMYLTPALLGAATCAGVTLAAARHTSAGCTLEAVVEPVAAIFGVLVTVFSRAAAVRWDWRLPTMGGSR